MPIAASFASAPPLAKRNPFTSAGQSSAMSAESRARTSVMPRPEYTYGMVASWSATPAATAGGTVCPKLEQTACDVQSRYFLPSRSYKYTPSPRTISGTAVFDAEAPQVIITLASIAAATCASDQSACVQSVMIWSPMVSVPE